MMLRRNSFAALSCAAVLLVAACGQRLDPEARRALADLSLSRDTATTAGAVVSGGPSLADVTSAPASTASSNGRAGGTAPLRQAGGPVPGASLGPQGNGGATDVAVTATSITVGLVADQTGPQPGLFNGDIAGVRAYFAYVNSKGGVHGRQLKVTAADSGIDCNSTTNAYATLVDKVFAFVGNLSVYDNCGVPVLKAHPDVPDVSYELTSEHANNPTTFSVQPNVPGARTGPPLAFAAAYPQVKGAVGALVADVAAARSVWAGEKQMLQSLGFKIVYEAYATPTEVDFTRYVIGMRQAGVQMVLLFNSAPNIAKFINSAQQQGYSPPVIDAPSSGYDPSIASLIGPAPTNFFSDKIAALYFDPAEGRRLPGVGLYQQWMAKTAPDQILDIFSVDGWTSALLFVQALEAAGPRATRAGLMAALRATHSVDTGGLMAEGDPAAKTPVNCFLIARYTRGEWQRWHAPSSGFDCSRPYYRVH